MMHHLFWLFIGRVGHQRKWRTTICFSKSAPSSSRRWPLLIMLLRGSANVVSYQALSSDCCNRPHCS